ncbi:hypothetical protein AAFH68_48090 [Flavobacterium sp. CGRL1]
MPKKKKYVLEQGWFFPHELEELPSISPYYLKGTRKNLSNGYTFVILHLMAEFGILKYKIPWQEKILNKDYKIPEKLNDVKKRIDEYAFENKSKLKYYTKSEIEAKRKKEWKNNEEIKSFNALIGDHNMLVKLRNQYLHCSANMDGTGMEPTQDSQSNIIWKRTLIKG